MRQVYEDLLSHRHKLWDAVVDVRPGVLASVPAA